MNVTLPIAHVAVVGCGNIGSRLLQSLAGIDSQRLAIRGYERIEGARAVANERFREACGERRHTLEFPDVDPDGPCVLGIVATDARNRLAGLRALLSGCAPKYVVLEKFLFTRREEYQDAADLLTHVGVRTWVNCSRNEWPGYRSLKDELRDQSVRSFEVKGRDWGLGCNSIHFLAALEFLANTKIASLRWRYAPERRDAKRAGYCELVGILEGETENGIHLSLASTPGDPEPPFVTIETDRARYTIRETGGFLAVASRDVSEERGFAMRYASGLAPVFDRIMREGRSGLPTFTEAATLHLKTMAVLNEGFFGTADLDLECPVT